MVNRVTNLIDESAGISKTTAMVEIDNLTEYTLKFKGFELKEYLNTIQQCVTVAVAANVALEKTLGTGFMDAMMTVRFNLLSVFSSEIVRQIDPATIESIMECDGELKALIIANDKAKQTCLERLLDAQRKKPASEDNKSSE